MKTYVTFGQIHTHSVNGKTFDKDSVAVIEAPTAEDGRNLAFEFFDDKFFTTYTEDQWDEADGLEGKRGMHYFPRGYIEAN